MPVAPPLGTLCTPAPACGPRPLTIVSMGIPAVNFSGQTERPWEVTIRLSYNFLPLKPMLKSSSKRGRYVVEIWHFQHKRDDGGSRLLRMRMNGNSRPFWQIWRERWKLDFWKFGWFFKKKWDDEGSRLSRVEVKGNSRSVWEICREKVKIPPSFWKDSCVQYQQARLGYSQHRACIAEA